ncbi:dTDP-4-dehydrorhamnose reductase [Pseudooceanicola sp. C21-150M6]|uniref:dTDP-4-dehydrorhamnose reductase n=1 Tax=Pseudooceanicola sp. C21-150M6 TaxID=3434355 RepID=UPI003D7F75ED
MTLLMFGRTGQVAQEVIRLCPGIQALDRSEADLDDPESCAAAIRDIRPDGVINAAAWTAVDAAEEEEAAALRVNGLSPGAMAQACAALDLPLVHLSTEYVFDGHGTQAHRPSDRPDPINAYGRSKLAGEMAIRESGARHVILRTSWVFSAHGSNFVRTMLRLSETRSELSVVSDQIGGPTPAAALADACLIMLTALTGGTGRSGTYHLSGQPEVSWSDFARAIFEMSGRPVTVRDIPTSGYPTPARRPLNSRLDCTDTERQFGIRRPDWRAGLTDVLTELGDIRT